MYKTKIRPVIIQILFAVGFEMFISRQKALLKFNERVQSNAVQSIIASNYRETTHKLSFAKSSKSKKYANKTNLKSFSKSFHT